MVNLKKTVKIQEIIDNACKKHSFLNRFILFNIYIYIIYLNENYLSKTEIIFE